ncbi:uncharacterized protein LOC105781426 [Gossypium raimondii]|uniref:uncharacterized protein LOC105781426 n=1 Tax=Gossypium raimondii TaxID=29730 RepID=UPI00063AADB3|nr:uncharacterized protein LOC105781426 [Gossypium raimondii]
MGKEHCKAIILRSGKQTGEPITDSTVASPDIGDICPDGKVDSEELVDVLDKEVPPTVAHMNYIRPQKLWTQPKVSPQPDVLPPVPFPQRFKRNENHKQHQQFLDTLKQLQINIPVVYALVKISSFGKFMKDLLSKKEKLIDVETIALTKSCSAILTNKLPPKCKHPGSFTIPCSIGNQYLGKNLCDLGVSINLMPLSTFRKLRIGHTKPTAVTLQLAV